MQETQQITPRILVTTDFSPESELAFYHALAFAVARKARLTLLHTGPESRDTVPWGAFPGVRETLAAWGLLAEDAPRSAVSDSLHVGVAKMAIRDDDPRQGITDYLRKHPTDLLIMARERLQNRPMLAPGWRAWSTHRSPKPSPRTPEATP